MAQAKYTTHHGMADILPGEVEKWQALERIIREEAALFNFEEIRTPIMEQTELIVRGLGQLTDIVSKEIFAFSRGEDQYILRPECTAPVVRAFVEHHMEQRGGTQKLYYIGPMFRAERPQKGRQRQFHQFGVELLGSDSPLADVETIVFMKRIYSRIGITNTTLHLNSVGDPESRAVYKEALKTYLRPHFESLSEISKARFEKNPMRILDSKEPEDKEILKNAPQIQDYLSVKSRHHFECVCGLLQTLGIEYTINPFLVRGMDYYTETAFELTSPDLGSQDALAGGGRYDLLVEEIGGSPTPAVGFAAGMERLIIACDELGISLAEESNLDVFIVTFGDAARNRGFEALQLLRTSGFAATMDFQGRSMKAQMKEANRKRTRFALIAGDTELEAGIFTVRNMHNSTEESLSLEEFIQREQKIDA